MRTTLDIDEDVLLAAKELARRERKTAGVVLSELARLGLRGGQSTLELTRARYGFVPKAAGGVTVTNAHIDALKESLGEG
jgi:hypothetical protein